MRAASTSRLAKDSGELLRGPAGEDKGLRHREPLDGPQRHVALPGVGTALASAPSAAAQQPRRGDEVLGHHRVELLRHRARPDVRLTDPFASSPTSVACRRMTSAAITLGGGAELSRGRGQGREGGRGPRTRDTSAGAGPSVGAEATRSTASASSRGSRACRRLRRAARPRRLARGWPGGRDARELVRPAGRLQPEGHRDRLLAVRPGCHRGRRVITGQAGARAPRRRHAVEQQRQGRANLQHHPGVHDVLRRGAPVHVGAVLAAAFSPGRGSAGRAGAATPRWRGASASRS